MVRHALRKGWRWSVDGGQSIDIWRDPWLPCPLSFHILSPHPAVTSTSHPIRYVADFIDGGRHTWNIPLIESLFYPIDEGTSQAREVGAASTS